MRKKLIYNSQGRGGIVTYTDERSSINFTFEFGGGNCIAIIFVPAPEHWEAQTNRTLSERVTILDFIAQKAAYDQVSDGYYRISENFIEIFSKQLIF